MVALLLLLSEGGQMRRSTPPSPTLGCSAPQVAGVSLSLLRNYFVLLLFYSQGWTIQWQAAGDLVWPKAGERPGPHRLQGPWRPCIVQDSMLFGVCCIGDFLCTFSGQLILLFPGPWSPCQLRFPGIGLSSLR